MPRIARALIRQSDSYPYYEWEQYFAWDDDEFQGRADDAKQEKVSQEEVPVQKKVV